ncbi:restriction endonuclease subunit S [Halorubrum pallidum]|uniref:Restriction endonuclease subunit S n=1 Tax=Halorubrum pallidum TaxID=1526114 RepID=A0ABD5T1R7_9EURY
MRSKSKPEWIAGLPEDWELSKVLWHYDVQLGKQLKEDEIEGDHLAPYLRNQDVQWWEVNTEDLPKMDFHPRERSKYELHQGDVLVCEGGEVGRSAVWDEENMECYFQKALHRVRPHSSEYDPRFFCYFMEFGKKSGLFSAGTNQSTIEHLTAEKLKRQVIPIPPVDEQEQLADYLDEERETINRLQSNYEELISRVLELINVKIRDTVTGGINHSNKKESGETWIGEIPEHWDVVRTRFVAELHSGHTPDRSNDEYWEDTDIPWVTTSDIKPFREGRKRYLHETDNQISEIGMENSGAHLLPERTVFLSRTASVGFSGIMSKPMATSQDFANWVCGEEIIPEYLLYVFRSMDQEFDRLMQGSTHKTIYMPDIKSFKTPLPPIEEQREIVEHIETETEQLWELIDRVDEAIDLLEEKRQALITAAVTGQIDISKEKGVIQGDD